MNALSLRNSIYKPLRAGGGTTPFRELLTEYGPSSPAEEDLVLNDRALAGKLESIDGKDYGAYQSLLGEYAFPGFQLIIHQIPKDPYAPPLTGVYRIQVPRNSDRVLNLTTRSKVQEIALRDFLARRFFASAFQLSASRRGTGYSGIITIDRPGQSVLERNSVVISDTVIEIRCFLGLPAVAGRQIDAKTAEQMLLGELPEIVRQSLFRDDAAMAALRQHIQTAEDAEFLRSRLAPRGLVAFIANQAVLPRKSGNSDKPMKKEQAIPFCAPESLQVKIKLPHAGWISGMGIPSGVTLIAGGGYHGKSTLLNVIASGIYDHIPGDGREHCISLSETVKIRSYSGRPIVKTDISPFIRNLHFGKNTSAFSTDNASGSTSQAANIIEAIEIGAKVLLMDEDTCATNFMIRDHKMQQLVHKNDEPITTFIDKVKQLYSERNISTVLVLGGSGDYFDVADKIIQMVRYQPFDVTDRAKEISKHSRQVRTSEGEDYPFASKGRIPLAESIDPRNEYGKKGIYATETHRLNFGRNVIDLTDVEQLLELSQTRALGFALDYARKYMDGRKPLKEIVTLVMKDIEEKGLDVLSDRLSGNFVRFRDMELAFTLNRLRGLQIAG